MWALVEEGEMGMFAGSGSGSSATTAEVGDARFQGMGQKGLCRDSPLVPRPLPLPSASYLLLQAQLQL